MDSDNDDRRDHQEERAFKDFINDVENHAQILEIHGNQLRNHRRLLIELCDDIAALKGKPRTTITDIQG
jgi:hypothetical protein